MLRKPDVGPNSLIFDTQKLSLPGGPATLAKDGDQGGSPRLPRCLDGLGLSLTCRQLTMSRVLSGCPGQSTTICPMRKAGTHPCWSMLCNPALHSAAPHDCRVFLGHIKGSQEPDCNKQHRASKRTRRRGAVLSDRISTNDGLAENPVRRLVRRGMAQSRRRC